MADGVERIIAPCVPGGEVRSAWKTSHLGARPMLEDDDSKDAECRCSVGACCVNERNEVVQGTVLSVGGPENVRKLLQTLPSDE